MRDFGYDISDGVKQRWSPWVGTAILRCRRQTSNNGKSRDCEPLPEIVFQGGVGSR